MLYKYNTKNENEYLGTYPQNEDGYVPPSLTLKPVPMVASGNIAIFHEDMQLWQEVQDNRGNIYYLKTNGTAIDWLHIRQPTSKEFELLTPMQPCQLCPIWDTPLGTWREKTASEIHQDNLNALGRPTIFTEGTDWYYDIEAQSIRQLAELLKKKYDNKVVLIDVWGAEHRLTATASNRVQKAQFEAYMNDRGVTP